MLVINKKILSSLFILFCFLVPVTIALFSITTPTAFANYSQSDISNSYTTHNLYFWFKGDFFGGEHIETMKLYGKTNSTNGDEQLWISTIAEVDDYTDLDANAFSNIYSGGASEGKSPIDTLSTTAQELTVPIVSGVSALSFDPDKYYRIEFDFDTGSPRVWYGATNSDTNSAFHTGNYTGATATLSGDSDLPFLTSSFSPYFEVTTTGAVYGGDPSETPSSFTINTPIEASVIYSDSFDIDFDFHYNGTGDYDAVGYKLYNISQGIQILTFEQDLIAIGAGSYTYEYTDMSDGVYQWNPYFRNNVNETFFNGTSKFFTLGTTTNSSLYTEPDTISTGTIPSLIRYFLIPTPASLNGFQNVNATLKTKFPFAYVYDFLENAKALYQSETTETFDFTVPFGDIGDITIISQQQIADAPFASTFKTFIGYGLWIMFLYGIYHRTLRIFNTNAN